MPIYTYKCKDCESITDGYNTIGNRHSGPLCCDKQTSLLIMPTQLQPVLGGGDFQGYMCPVTEKFIDSRKKRREIIKEHDLVEKG